jgi:hypothetical protein
LAVPFAELSLLVFLERVSSPGGACPEGEGAGVFFEPFFAPFVFGGAALVASWARRISTGKRRKQRA